MVFCWWKGTRYLQKKNVNAEINLYKTLKKEYPGGVYLKPIPDYKIIPELESMEYVYGSRWLLSEYGITKRKYRLQHRLQHRL